MITVTEVFVTPIKPFNGLVGFASVVINDAIKLDCIGLHKKRDAEGYRLTFPTKQRGNGTAYIFKPIRQDACKAIETAIFAALDNLLKDVSENSDRHGCTLP